MSEINNDTPLNNLTNQLRNALKNAAHDIEQTYSSIGAGGCDWRYLNIRESSLDDGFIHVYHEEPIGWDEAGNPTEHRNYHLTITDYHLMDHDDFIDEYDYIKQNQAELEFRKKEAELMAKIEKATAELEELRAGR